MCGDDDAEFLGERERAVEFRVIHAERAFVGEEDFERTDSAPHDFAELLPGLVVELRHAHVEREVARGFADRLLHPQIEALQRVVLARRAAHLDERGRAANERSLAAGLVVVF